MALPVYTQNLLLNFLLCATGTAPTSHYLALFVGDPLNGGVEVFAGEYARQSVAFSLLGGVARNSADVTFPTPAATWDTITHLAIYDALTNGHLLLPFSLEEPMEIDTGVPAVVLAGVIEIDLE